MEKFTTVISASSTFCASLHLPVKGKCGSLHGYTFNVSASVEFKNENDCFILDYNKLEKILAQHCQELYYCDLNKNKHFSKKAPSAENIAKWLIENLEQDLATYPFSALTVKISTRPNVSISITKHVK